MLRPIQGSVFQIAVDQLSSKCLCSLQSRNTKNWVSLIMILLKCLKNASCIHVRLMALSEVTMCCLYHREARDSLAWQEAMAPRELAEGLGRGVQWETADR